MIPTHTLHEMREVVAPDMAKPHARQDEGDGGTWPS